MPILMLVISTLFYGIVLYACTEFLIRGLIVTSFHIHVSQKVSRQKSVFQPPKTRTKDRLWITRLPASYNSLFTFLLLNRISRAFKGSLIFIFYDVYDLACNIPVLL